MRLFLASEKPGHAKLEDESLMSGMYTTEDPLDPGDQHRVNLGAQPSPSHTEALADMTPTPTASNRPKPHTAAEIAADLAAAEAGEMPKAPPLLPAPTGIESEGPEPKEENSQAQTNEAQTDEDGDESVPLVHVESGPIDLDSGAPAIMGTAISVPARQTKVPNLALEQAGVVQEATDEETLEQQSYEFSLEDDNSFVRNMNMDNAFGAEMDTDGGTRRHSLKSNYSFESSLKSLDDTFLKDAKIPNPNNYRKAVSSVPSQQPSDSDAAEAARSTDGGSKKSSRIPGFVNAWNLLRAGRRSSNASLESSCVRTRLQDTSIDSDYLTARSPRRPGHASVSDAEQPSNPRRPSSPPRLQRSTSQKVPASPLSQRDSLSDKDYNKTFEADDDLESDSQSDGLGELEDVHRFPEKPRRQCRTEILLLVLIAVLFLSVTIAIVSAVAITENNRAVAGVAGSRAVDRPLTGGGPTPTASPTSGPTVFQTSSPTTTPTGVPTTSPTQAPSPGPSSSPSGSIQFVKTESAGIVEYSCQTQVVPAGYSNVQFQLFVARAEICVNNAAAIGQLPGITSQILQNEIVPELAAAELGNCHTNKDTEFTDLVWNTAKIGDLNGFRYLGNGITCFDWENMEFQLNYFTKLRRRMNLQVVVSNQNVAKTLNETLVSVFSQINTTQYGLESLDYSGITNIQKDPTQSPTPQPSANPEPSATPTTNQPSVSPTAGPTNQPTSSPSHQPTHQPTLPPTNGPTSPDATASPSQKPTLAPTLMPTSQPTTPDPSSSPSRQPTLAPTLTPTSQPTTPHPTSSSPTLQPTNGPTKDPTWSPTETPTRNPTSSPTTAAPTLQPSATPTSQPSKDMRMCESNYYCMILDLQNECCPTKDGVWLDCCEHKPTSAPSGSPTTSVPTASPTNLQSTSATSPPTASPSQSPTNSPTSSPEALPTQSPTANSPPTSSPSASPSKMPSRSPSLRPTSSPTSAPSAPPSKTPSTSPTAPSASPTPSPTSARVISIIQNAAGPSSLSALSDPDSPQSAALSHVASDPNATTRADIDLIQEFALLSFAFQSIETGGTRLLSSSPQGRRMAATSWPDAGHNPCDWVGVFCNYLDRVIAINIAQRGLPGRLVPEWALLKDSLQLIDATNNKLTGQIPAEYGDLHLLRWFRVSGNQISGNIPLSFQNLGSLMQLYVQHNQMSGPFPNHVLSEMSSLNQLRIYFNQFSGTIDDSVCAAVFEADCYLGGTCVTLCWEA